MKKVMITGIASAVVLVAAAIAFGLPGGDTSLKAQLSSCFERYTHGLTWTKYSLIMVEEARVDSRTEISREQIRCAVTRLGFDSTELEKMVPKTEGRVDSDKYGITWGPHHDEFICWGSDITPKCAKTNLDIKITDYR